MWYWAAIFMGLAGSLHCIGMCGPLALALPLEESKWANIYRRLTYQLGRILTYGVLGLLIGFLGKNLNLFGWQQAASIIAGVFLIVVFVFGYLFKSNPILLKWNALLNKLFKNIWNIKGGFGSFLFGILNGFLPCGLVYLALAGSLVTADPINGFFYMVLFGLGTFPAMFFISLAKTILKPSHKKLLKRVNPILVLLFASIFILRGLGLGIPYLSPKLDKHTDKVECCHPNKD